LQFTAKPLVIGSFLHNHPNATQQEKYDLCKSPGEAEAQLRIGMVPTYHMRALSNGHCT